ncbi:MAG: XdhC family protein [Proteobacteria bacterium]|nr:XdhC family protein [Pseudomonadota bacterium]
MLLQRVLDAYRELVAAGETGVLATLVRVDGHGYRRPGARWLQREGGSAVGLLSGGCIEAELAVRAERVRRGDAPEPAVFASEGAADPPWSWESGCAGTLSVWLEPVDARRDGGLRARARARDARIRGATAFVWQGPGDAPGRRWEHDSRAVPPGWPAGTEGATRRALARAVATGREQHVEAPGVSIWVEAWRPPPRLLVLGTGPDARAVCRLAVALDWEVEVAGVGAQRWPGVRRAWPCRPGALVGTAPPDATTEALVMTHHWPSDLEWLRWLRRTDVAGVGVLGPRERTEALLEAVDPDKPFRDRLRFPVGLDLGGDGPEAVALSIVAELQARVGRGSGERLALRAGPIHGDSA